MGFGIWDRGLGLRAPNSARQAGFGIGHLGSGRFGIARCVLASPADFWDWGLAFGIRFNEIDTRSFDGVLSEICSSDWAISKKSYLTGVANLGIDDWENQNPFPNPQSRNTPGPEADCGDWECSTRKRLWDLGFGI